MAKVRSYKGKSIPCDSGLFHFPLTDKERLVTLRRVLSHTAGMAHYSNGDGSPSPPQKLCDDPKYNTGPKWALSWLFDKPLIAVPGATGSYSTHGINFAGVALAEAVTSTFEALAKERVFTPAKMSSAQPDKEWLKLPHRAVGYWKNDAGKVLLHGSNDVSWKLPGGGFVSTIADLDRFCGGLIGDALLSTEQKEAAWTKAKLSAGSKKGKEVGNGLAFSIGSRKGKGHVGHSGSQQKARTILRLFTGEGLCLGIMTNIAWADPGKLVASLEDDVRAALALDP